MHFARTMMKICPLILALCLATSTNAAIRYVDNAATGLNNGSSWANAWTSTSAITGLAAGDTVFISGGATSKTYNLSSWRPAAGVNGTPITYRTGQEAGHNGTVIFNVGGNNNWLLAVNNVTISGEVNGERRMVVTNAAYEVVRGDGSRNLRLSYIHFPNMVGGMKLNNGGGGIVIDNCYIHKVPNPSGGVNDRDFVIEGLSGNAFDVNKVHNNTILLPARTTDSAWGDDGIKWAGGTSFYSNLFKTYFTNYPGGQHADVFQVAGSFLKIYANTFENVGESCIYHDVFSVPTAIQGVQIYNNVFYHSASLKSGVARGFDIGPELGGIGSTFTDCFIANNTFVDFTAIWAISWENAAGYTRCYVVNNIFYNCEEPMAHMNPPPPGMTIMYNKAVAGPRGTGTLSPPNSAGPGGSGTVQFLSYSEYNGNNNFHLTGSDTGARNAGTNWPAQYFNTDKDGVPRPQGSAWDLGAYEYNTGTGTNLPPTVSAIGYTNADADPSSPGLQVLAGTTGQYTGSASDPNGDALTWQWIYSVNGGPETNFSSGSGIVQPASFVYATSAAGNSYLWKLRVSDGQVTTESLLTVSVILPPGAGIVLEAESGILTAPFSAIGSFISQPSLTSLINGGRATYNFNITTAGTYAIQGVVNAPNDSANSFFLNIDAEPQDPSMTWQIQVTSGFEARIVNWQGTGTFDNPQFAPKIFNLTAGAHQLIIRGREGGAQLDRVIIMEVPQAPPNVRIVPDL